MKIQLNYDTKVVTVEKRVNIKELFDTLKRILPDWKEWELSTNTEIIWRNPIPIVIEPNPYIYPQPPKIWYGGATDMDTTVPEPSGVFQLDVSWNQE